MMTTAATLAARFANGSTQLATVRVKGKTLEVISARPVLYGKYGQNVAVEFDGFDGTEWTTVKVRETANVIVH